MQAVENEALECHLERLLDVAVNLIEKIVGTVEAAVHIDIAVDFPTLQSIECRFSFEPLHANLPDRVNRKTRRVSFAVRIALECVGILLALRVPAWGRRLIVDRDLGAGFALGFQKHPAAEEPVEFKQPAAIGVFCHLDRPKRVLDLHGRDKLTSQLAFGCRTNRGMGPLTIVIAGRIPIRLFEPSVILFTDGELVDSDRSGGSLPGFVRNEEFFRPVIIGDRHL